MKKLYSLFLSIGLASAVNAQVEIREYTGTGGTEVGNDISGTNFQYVAGDGEFYIHFAVKNVSGTNQRFRISRLRIDAPTDWEKEICWGQDPDDYFESICVLNSLIGSSNPCSTTKASCKTQAQKIGNGSIGDLKIKFEAAAAGEGHYRFYVVTGQGGNLVDSVDLTITKPLSITEEKEELGMTAYPNPANSYLTVNTTGTDENVNLRITDVLGKVVYNEVVSPLKKIDVSEYKNGVYLVSVYREGTLVQTRRVVVRH